MYTERVWISALCEKKKFSEIDHQHLSNILWFNAFFNNRNGRNDRIMFELELELQRRFEGVQLEWKPLPIPGRNNLSNVVCLDWSPPMISGEIDLLNAENAIDCHGNIIGNKFCGIFMGQKIGTITHI